MMVDISIKKVHNSNKKHTGKVIMLKLIDPIVRNVSNEYLKQYLAQKGIDINSIDWSIDKNLLSLEIEKVLNRPSNKNKKDLIFSNFLRIIKMSGENGKESLFHCGFSFVDLMGEDNISQSFCTFLWDIKLFEKAEAHLDENNQYKQFLQNLLTNGRLIGGLFFLISFFINIAQICSDENDARYVALNVFHFILGSLTVYCFNKHKDHQE